MFCQKCGKEIADDAIFCQFCGHQNNILSDSKPQVVYVQQVTQRKPKSQFIAILLLLFLGVFGVHDFYLERNGCAVAKLCITVFLGWFFIGFVITSIWCLIDLISILCKGYDILMTDEEIAKQEKYRREYFELKEERKQAEKENGF